MADQLSLRGGTTAEHATFTGANKEVTVDTTKKTLVVNDGATVGGHPLMRENASNSALTLGSAGTPSLKFTGDTNTGIYSPGADQLAVSTGGTGRLFVGASGNVGVGTATIDERLHIEGSSANVRVKIENTSTGIAGLVMLNTNRRYDFQVNGSDLQIADNSPPTAAERLRITSAGKVGIGTSVPGAPLHVNTSGNQRIDLAKFELSGQRSLWVQGQWGSLDIGSINGILQYTNSGNLGFRTSTSGNANMLLDTVGRLGIGTTSPATSSVLHYCGWGEFSDRADEAWQ
jgi:hypothetical protein